MTKTQRLLRRIATQEDVIRTHRNKIVQERQKPNVHWGLIAHWQAEIQAAQAQIVRLQRRLNALRRRS